MGLLYERIRGTCEDPAPGVGCKIITEAFNMAILGWADGLWTKADIVASFDLTTEEVGPGDGTYLTLDDMRDWYLASSNRMKYIFCVGQLFRHLETVNDAEHLALELTDLEVCTYLKGL